MSLILKPDPNDKRRGHYVVLCEGKVVGQIFDRIPGASAARDATWLWSISDRRREPGSQGGAGDAATREAAMVAFRIAWDTLGDRQDRFHDCPHCEGKAKLPVPGKAAFKCTRCGKVTTEAELRIASMKRNPSEDD